MRCVAFCKRATSANPINTLFRTHWAKEAALKKYRKLERQFKVRMGEHPDSVLATERAAEWDAEHLDKLEGFYYQCIDPNDEFWNAVTMEEILEICGTGFNCAFGAVDGNEEAIGFCTTDWHEDEVSPMARFYKSFVKDIETLVSAKPGEGKGTDTQELHPWDRRPDLRPPSFLHVPLCPNFVTKALQLLEPAVIVDKMSGRKATHFHDFSNGVYKHPVAHATSTLKPVTGLTHLTLTQPDRDALIAKNERDALGRARLTFVSFRRTIVAALTNTGLFIKARICKAAGVDYDHWAAKKSARDILKSAYNWNDAYRSHCYRTKTDKDSNNAPSNRFKHILLRPQDHMFSPAAAVGRKTCLPFPLTNNAVEAGAKRGLLIFNEAILYTLTALNTWHFALERTEICDVVRTYLSELLQKPKYTLWDDHLLCQQIANAPPDEDEAFDLDSLDYLSLIGDIIIARKNAQYSVSLRDLERSLVNNELMWDMDPKSAVARARREQRVKDVQRRPKGKGKAAAKDDDEYVDPDSKPIWFVYCLTSAPLIPLQTFHYSAAVRGLMESRSKEGGLQLGAQHFPPRRMAASNNIPAQLMTSIVFESSSRFWYENGLMRMLRCIHELRRIEDGGARTQILAKSIKQAKASIIEIKKGKRTGSTDANRRRLRTLKAVAEPLKNFHYANDAAVQLEAMGAELVRLYCLYEVKLLSGLEEIFSATSIKKEQTEDQSESEDKEVEMEVEEGMEENEVEQDDDGMDGKEDKIKEGDEKDEEKENNNKEEDKVPSTPEVPTAEPVAAPIQEAEDEKMHEGAETPAGMPGVDVVPFTQLEFTAPRLGEDGEPPSLVTSLSTPARRPSPSSSMPRPRTIVKVKAPGPLETVGSSQPTQDFQPPADENVREFCGWMKLPSSYTTELGTFPASSGQFSSPDTGKVPGSSVYEFKSFVDWTLKQLLTYMFSSAAQDKPIEVDPLPPPSGPSQSPAAVVEDTSDAERSTSRPTKRPVNPISPELDTVNERKAKKIREATDTSPTRAAEPRRLRPRPSLAALQAETAEEDDSEPSDAPPQGGGGKVFHADDDSEPLSKPVAPKKKKAGMKKIPEPALQQTTLDEPGDNQPVASGSGSAAPLTRKEKEQKKKKAEKAKREADKATLTLNRLSQNHNVTFESRKAYPDPNALALSLAFGFRMGLEYSLLCLVSTITIVAIAIHGSNIRVETIVPNSHPLIILLACDSRTLDVGVIAYRQLNSAGRLLKILDESELSEQFDCHIHCVAAPRIHHTAGTLYAPSALGSDWSEALDATSLAPSNSNKFDELVDNCDSLEDTFDHLDDIFNELWMYQACDMSPPTSQPNQEPHGLEEKPHRAALRKRRS
ncbi:hypothetical protein PENSPDRAFT_671492 [Peniophora sp. CONT]|nr:hypothetical protein PENSPDRAFT_671492 [Peniophora sp. CONT]